MDCLDTKVQYIKPLVFKANLHTGAFVPKEDNAMHRIVSFSRAAERHESNEIELAKVTLTEKCFFLKL